MQLSILEAENQLLKTELEEKTRVPADRMKLMAKSKGEEGGAVYCSFNELVEKVILTEISKVFGRVY